MALISRGVVKVAGAYRGDNVVRLMQRHRYTIEDAEGTAYDFLSGTTRVVMVDDADKMGNPAQRKVVTERLVTLKGMSSSTSQNVVLLLRVVSPEVRPDILSWLNVHCSVELGCCVILFWTDEECAAYLEGLSEGSAVSVDYCMNMKKDNTPMQALIDALTQTPHLLSRNDVIRAVHRFGSVAGLLTATAEELSLLPGVAQKKANKLHATLNAPFSTSRCLVSDVIAEDDNVDEIVLDPVRRAAQDSMKRVLQQMCDREDEEV